jgi:hypothetical protein
VLPSRCKEIGEGGGQETPAASGARVAMWVMETPHADRRVSRRLSCQREVDAEEGLGVARVDVDDAIERFASRIEYGRNIVSSAGLAC